MAQCSPSALLAQGACFQCLNPQQMDMVALQLLCDISANGGGGGGGGGNVYAGSGNPNGVQSATGVAVYFDTSTEQTYWKTTLGTSNNEWV